MTNIDQLARPYAVISEEGVVIDRLLIDDYTYELTDFSERYPGCVLELDEENLKPIGHGAPPVDPADRPASPPSIEEVIRSLDPARRSVLLAALTEPSADTNPA